MESKIRLEHIFVMSSNVVPCQIVSKRKVVALKQTVLRQEELILFLTWCRMHFLPDRKDLFVASFAEKKAFRQRENEMNNIV